MRREGLIVELRTQRHNGDAMEDRNASAVERHGPWRHRRGCAQAISRVEDGRIFAVTENPGASINREATPSVPLQAETRQ
jgi:hypothetical protein